MLVDFFSDLNQRKHQRCILAHICGTGEKSECCIYVWSIIQYKPDFEFMDELLYCRAIRQVLRLRLVPQEFFSLAWSSVLMSRGDQGSAQLCSILAAGGKRGVVKLIHPRNNLAYGEFRASRKSLSVLRFHEQQGNLLFSKI